MNIENPTNSTSEERQRLEREQDELFAQLQSDPNNIDAKEELTKTIEQIKALGGPENTNINKILQNLNEKANKTLTSEDTDADTSEVDIDEVKKRAKAKIEEFIEKSSNSKTNENNTSEGEGMLTIRSTRNEINELLSKIPAEALGNILEQKIQIDQAAEDLLRIDPIEAKELSSLLGRYNILLDDIKIVAKKY